MTVGIGARLREAAAALAGRTATATLPPVAGDVAQVRHLPGEVAAAFGLNLASDYVTREQAMSIPAVRRGRAIIAGTIGTLPLIALRQSQGVDGQLVPDAPVQRVRRSLLEQPDPAVTRQFTLTWTVDDLIFYGVSWWRVLARDAQGYPSNGERIARSRITLDQHRRQALIDGVPVANRDIVRIDGPDEGLLAVARAGGANPLLTALKLEAAAQRYADLDVPVGVLRDTGTVPGKELTDDEIDELLEAWESARRRRRTGYVGRSLEYQATQFNAEQLQLTQARQHAAAEIARLLNLEAAALNAPGATGMTYTNTEATRRGRIDSLAPYLEAIAQRLSLGDATPRGQRVAFDTQGYIRGDESERVTQATAAAGRPVLTVSEARDRYFDLPPAPELEQDPPAAEQPAVETETQPALEEATP